MINKTTTIFAVLFFLGGTVKAQENTVATGGEATGSGGSASYTTGQIVYTQKTGAGGSESQGVQQPYEITVTTGINEVGVNLKMNVYPNPTTNYLTLDVENKKLEQISYQLIDMQGKIIEVNKLIANTTLINMEGLPKGAFILNVIENNKSIKTFNIIKK